MNSTEPMEPIFDHFENYIEVSNELKSELTKRIKEVHFRKSELVLDANTICTKSYFISEGILRTYFIKDGLEITEYFSASYEWVNSPKSFILKQKDIYYIDAIENTTAYCLEIEDLMYLFDHFPEMERYARLSMGSVFGHLMERITSIRFTSAKDKYEHFQKTYHDIYHRIPLGMVASYLGITQETLSRIRAEK
ncbi:cAMP-binding domain of CRP or a regulatory subunit of cAMP-dependent protein kinases [Marivirga sericea]|uniref:cAMP-binding domain of CRP or a regulatory subunit of cAMP-dependent protein kinases n=1 Tax=Marivirga sericea TaxID=1028 RepID=A0A1X7IFY3_9BACT|nr:Crp/Fnr family transcriptional regulator [Marivirga sericea]SMG13709.1 cAMP-binding domain of CRP or a regulatory subunit of cAMP-dependent protein kinases [Marivirga sericea]